MDRAAHGTFLPLTLFQVEFRKIRHGCNRPNVVIIRGSSFGLQRSFPLFLAGLPKRQYDDDRTGTSENIADQTPNHGKPPCALLDVGRCAVGVGVAGSGRGRPSGRQSHDAGPHRLGRRRRATLGRDHRRQPRAPLGTSSAGHRGRRAGLDVAGRRPAGGPPAKLPRSMTASMSCSAPRRTRSCWCNLTAAGRCPAAGRRSKSRWPTCPANSAICNSTPTTTACWSAARRATSCASTWPGKSLVFSPGEKLRLEVEPHLLPVAADTKIRLKAQLLSAGRRREAWSTQQPETRAGDAAGIPLEIPLPEREGVYDLESRPSYASSWPHSVRASLNWKRRSPSAGCSCWWSTARPASPSPVGPGRRTEPGRSKSTPPIRAGGKKGKLPQLPRLTRLEQGPLGNGTLPDHAPSAGRIGPVETQRSSPDVSWEAYTLSVNQPGRPHVLEVDYPSDVPQTLGLSILEPNAAARWCRSGWTRASTWPRGRWPTPRRTGPQHRLVFWPRTTSPLLLMTNRRERRRPSTARSACWAAGSICRNGRRRRAAAAGRLLAAYLDRPLLPENFSADEVAGRLERAEPHDWATFHEAGTRLVEYLHYVGYNGLMLSVLADGSTIYPSELLEPTPRYDTGVFFASGQDPMRKDVLEMLLRLFDREELQLIPAVEFAAPLPALEALRGAAARRPRARVDRPRRHDLAPDLRRPPRPGPLLQHARSARAGGDAGRGAGTGRALRPAPVVRRPGPAAFGLRLCPAARAGMGHGRRHDRPLRARHAGCRCRATGPRPLRRPRAFLTSDAPRGVAAMAGRRSATASIAASARPWPPSGPTCRSTWPGPKCSPARKSKPNSAPSCRRKTTLADALLRAGIDPRQYQDDHGLVLLRPERIVPGDAAHRPGRRPGTRPDARGRPLLPRTAAAGQPVLPSAAGGPHAFVRSEEPLQAELRLAGDAGGALRHAEPAAIRPQPGRRWTRRSWSTAAGCCRWARKRRCATWRPPTAGCRRCVSRRRRRRRGGRQPVTFRCGHRARAGPTPTPSTTPPSPRRPQRPRWRPRRTARSASSSGPRPRRRRLSATPTARPGSSSWSPTTWWRSTFSEPGVQAAPAAGLAAAAAPSGPGERIRQLGARAAALRNRRP